MTPDRFCSGAEQAICSQKEVPVRVMRRVGNQDQVSQTPGAEAVIRRRQQFAIIEVGPHVSIDHHEAVIGQQRQRIDDAAGRFQTY